MHCASDLLAFKADFLSGHLPADLMPLFAFPGGYGGMVHSNGGRVSLSLCIRRDVLEAARRHRHGRSAGDAVIGHIVEFCRGVREGLADAERHGAWLAAGPIRPGIRKPYADGVFAVGNLAGEAHPIIAEGIGMAIQSSRLLAAGLIARRSTLTTESGRARAGRAYSIAWRRCFATRIRASALLAGLAVRPGASVLIPLLERFPEILTIGARLSGKLMLPPAGPAPGPEAAGPMA
jgi:flavin-dependent dehydrogenase